MTALGKRAVVAGGSLAGFLGARAVAPHFDEVVVLERDEFGATPAPRATTPQSHHVHVLLKGGENAIARLVPGFREAIEASGSVKLRGGKDLLAGSELGYAPRWDSEIELHGQSRWMLEHCLRTRVLATTPNLRLETKATVRGLELDRARNRITGVVIERDGARSPLEADLVVDATGRGEGGLRWLSALGVPSPAVEEVIVEFGYASVLVELAADYPRDWKGVVVGNLPRVGARGAVLLPIEGGRFICSLGSRAGDFLPEDEAQVREFAKALPQPALFDALSRARFLTPVARMIYPANRFRHYERMTALPDGLLPLGDALCSFNPTYGQGMSSAALQAGALFDVLAERKPGAPMSTLAHDYLLRAAEAVRLPWRNANYNDFLYPTTKGDRSMFTDEEMRYRTQLAIAGVRDEVVRKLANEVSQLLVPFERLLEDDIRARVAAAQPPS